MKTLNECVETALKNGDWYNRLMQYGIFDLAPNKGQKSFYHKARVEFNLKTGVYRLYSYYSLIMEYNSTTNKIRRLWFGYSVTTQRHINAFLDLVGKSEFAGKHNTEKMNEGVEY